MANQGRLYGEGLVGPLERGQYETQRNVAQDIYKTNWDNIKNQYANLKADLERSRQKSNRDFAQGLTNVMEGSFARSRNASQNLANRGLNVSGMQNMVQQADTERKGQEVLNLLGTLGGQMTSGAEKLKKGGETIAQQEGKLNANLGQTLGDIDAGETRVQMAYNQGLADIAGAKDARDMENELAAMQRAAQARAASSGKKSKTDEDIEEAHRRKAITAILMGVNPETGEELGYDDRQKENTLKILFGINNADKVVEAYNSNAKFDETKKGFEDQIKKYEKDIKNQQQYVNIAQNQKDIYEGKLSNGLTMKKDTKEGWVNDMANSSNDILAGIAKYVLGGRSQKDIDNSLNEAVSKQNINNINLQNTQNSLNNMTMQELADLLYGGR